MSSFLRCVSALAVVLLGAAPAIGLETASEIEDCMQANFPTDSSVQTVQMNSYDRMGSENRMRAKIYWQKDKEAHSKVLMRFDDPPDMRGSSILMIEKAGRNDMFMYLPELKRVRRITSHMMSGSMFGTDLSYEDFERMQGMADDATTERLADADAFGRSAYVLQQTPAADSGSEYEKVVSYIDQKTCVPLRVEFFTRGNHLRKVLEADPSTLAKGASGWLTHKLAIRDLRDETHTEVALEKIETGVALPRKTFTQSNLAHGH